MRLTSDTTRQPLNAELFENPGKVNYLTSLVMHDLKTPLQCIYLLSEKLVSDHPDAIGKIQECVREMNDMIRNLQSHQNTAQAVAESLPQTSLRKVLQEVCAICPGSERLTIDQPKSDVLIPMNRQDLYHTLQNLITNSIRHGGQQISIRVKENDGAMCIDYSDGGPGIPEQIWKKIRQQPYPTDDAVPCEHGMQLLFGFLRLNRADISPLCSGEVNGVRIRLQQTNQPMSLNSGIHPTDHDD